MGIYLPNMEMPKKGNWVTLRVFPDGQCSLYSWCGNDFDFVEHLTAVPVPPHGRLIIKDGVRIINQFLAADVQPVVRGKWIPDYDFAEYDFDGSTPLLEPRKYQDGWQCGLCGQYMPSEANFCPNCGADMRGEN